MKTIYAIFQQHRVMGTNEPWRNQTLMWCVTTKKEAEEDTSENPKGKIKNDGYLEYKYTYEEIELFSNYQEEREG